MALEIHDYAEHLEKVTANHQRQAEHRSTSLKKAPDHQNYAS